jgi:DNA modification methylase
MEKSQMDLKYITKTETNKITTLIILNSKMTLNIKDYIVDAIKTKREIGGNLVENAENTNEWNKIITKNLMEYILGANPAVLETQLKIKASVGNFHSTVKPIKLMSYLITMTTRPGDVVLDPFMGSGSTGCAAVLLRREFIGVEMDEGYMEISKKRIDYWNGKVDKKTDLFEE